MSQLNFSCGLEVNKALITKYSLRPDTVYTDDMSYVSVRRPVT